ncbi:ATP-dependent helicase/nuclease subunit A [Acidovorax sp. 62]|uniref:UvrD-helicase domain-containing protein n=1 Tax=Acidovorax sp. 62 TaxID=2035203 RepID=UPI000C182C8E|nr:UvrD-helicase domain-containing protein [Acidovorax sp. 62]PIF91355.1 ATP-dependent helicase/nuclease subunit A [Acidovorax sp. 62]
MTVSIPQPSQAAYEHNGRPVSREAFYAIACDPARSVAVEACAGAGKTWMLVSRMLRALLDGCAPHEILAITFTKKAAGEMRQRLQEWLEQFSHKPLEELTAELIARGISPQGALEKREALQNLYRQLLTAGRPVQIRTFHSWFAALLGTAPLALLQQQGLPAHFELLEDDAEAVREVWPPFLQTVADSASLRADYEAVVARHGRSQTHKALAAALAKRVEFDLADEAGVVDASVPPFQQAYPELAALAEPSDALQTEAALQRWRSRASALGAEANKTPQKAADAIIDALACADLNQRLDQLRRAMFVAKEDRLSKNLEKFPAAQEAEPELQRLLTARRQHEAWQHQQRMARLARCLIAQFVAVKQQHGWVDMNDVERTALVMLADPILSGWVQERLDARIRHLLVDEFQDTNPLQWQALHAWLSGYAGSGGGSAAPSVFIVGDPKQSIYRFRRAEPQVFIAAQAFVRDGLGGDLLSCDHTRRNAQGVIGAVNAVMGEAQAQHETSGFRDHTTESKHPGQLLRLPAVTDADDDSQGAGRDALAWRDSLTEPRHEAEETQRMRECTQAAAWVAAQIASGTPPKEVLVLARKRDRLASMQDALRALHLPCVQPEKADLFDAPEVQDMVALLDVLVSPTHDLSLARALKSPLFGLGDDALVALAVLRRQSEHAGSSWFDMLLKSELLPLDMQALGPVLIQYQAWVGSLPPHDALHAIYEHGDVLARFAAAAPPTQRLSVQANLRALLAAALQHDGGRYLTPYALVRAMKKGGVRAPGRADAQAIRLLTVHGAKGLEADCVLLLDTDTRPQKAETMGVLVDWPGEQTVPSAFVFLASESNPPPSAEAALAAEQQARSREELNMLYVAMTRAKHCLALSSVQPSNSAPGSWWNRLTPLAPLVTEVDAGTAPAPAAGAEATPDTFTIAALQPLPEALQSARTKPGAAASADPSGATPVAMPGDGDSTPLSRQGDAMHQLLEQAGVAGAPLADLRAHGWPAARIARLASDHDIAPAAAELAARMARGILAGEGAWAWDLAQVQTAINEAPLHYQGQSLRIDRLVQRRASPADDAVAGWWVLDYKSAAQPQRQQALVAQLQRYHEAVQALMPGEVVHAAFLTGDGRMVRVGDGPAGGTGASGGTSESGKAGPSAAQASGVGHTSAPVASAAAPKSERPRAAPGPADSAQGSLF